jgi:pyridoxal phosphate enzyme (YggS family)
MSAIRENIIALKKQVPESVRIVAVSKTKPAADIMEAYSTGHRMFGENRVQELLSKKDDLPGDIEWHLIGHLQTNKVKFIVPFISMIHSVDSFRLLKVINTEASLFGRTIDCLVQFHIASEETKFGFSPEEAERMLDSEEFGKLTSVRICGVMGMGTFSDDMELVRKEFRTLVQYFSNMKENYFRQSDYFSEISMGMSGDYMTAVEEGSTIVRIGSIIFGDRNK